MNTPVALVMLAQMGRADLAPPGFIAANELRALHGQGFCPPLDRRFIQRQLRSGHEKMARLFLLVSGFFSP